MGFYNVLQGDMPYFKELADHYSMSDNYHQPVMAERRQQHHAGFWRCHLFSDADGKPARPPHNEFIWSGTPDAGTVDEVENPNPVPARTTGGFRWIRWRRFRLRRSRWRKLQQLLRSGSAGRRTNRKYLRSLARPINPNCEEGTITAEQLQSGILATVPMPTPTALFTTHRSPFTTNQRSIADVMLETTSRGSPTMISGSVPHRQVQLNYGTVGPNGDQYCNICNPFHIRRRSWPTMPFAPPTLLTPPIFTMTSPAPICRGSYVKPSGWVTVIQLIEVQSLRSYVKKIVDASRATRNSGRAPRSSSP